MTFHPERAVELLVCPQSHAELVYDGKSLVSTDPHTRLRYAIRDEIPVMLVDDAKTVPTEEWEGLMRKHRRNPVSGQVITGELNGESTPMQGESS